MLTELIVIILIDYRSYNSISQINKIII